MSVAFAPRAHRGERFVARCVDERDRVPVEDGLVGTDVLRDTAGFTGDDVGVADRVEQRGLAVVDVAHHRDDRRAAPARGVVFVVVVTEQCLELELGFLAGLDEQHLGAERLGDELDHLVGQRLRAGDHLARVEQQADEVGGGAVQLGRELLDGDAALDDDLAVGDRGVTRRELRHRRRAEVFEVATTPLLAPGPLTLRAGATAPAGATTTRTTGTAAGTARATTTGSTGAPAPGTAPPPAGTAEATTGTLPAEASAASRAPALTTGAAGTARRRAAGT